MSAWGSVLAAVMLQGPYPLLVTPWTEDAKLDVPVLVKEADYVNACGVGGIIWPPANEVLGTLKKDEYTDGLRALAKRSVEAKYEARITAICPGKTSEDAVKLGALVQSIADETGAKMAILARPPDNATNQLMIADHYRAFAKVVKMPVIIQTYNGKSPQPDVAVVVKLAQEFPDIYGYVKEESPGLQVNARMEQLLSHPEIKMVFSGWGGKGWIYQGSRIGTKGLITQRPAYASLFVKVYNRLAAGADASDPELADAYTKYLYMTNLGDVFSSGGDDAMRDVHLYVLQKLGIFRNRLTRDVKGKVTEFAMTDKMKAEVEARMQYCGLLK
ncbi:MAG TPA: hypothetical protein P5026_05245 [Kiritimatiellia bacterium]|mgnify:CR=1 FL=1|nr:hypothetical protein [Kiritimatiellia bacterium]HRU70511.1 hypothetical protein [Kiritimatiellia bacterium]